MTMLLFSSLILFFFLMIRRPPRSTLFPYTTSSDLPVEQVDCLPPAHALVAVGDDAREVFARQRQVVIRSEEHTSELQSHSDLVCRLLLEKKKKNKNK